MRPRQKLVWSSTQVAAAQAASVKTSWLGKFPAPAAKPFVGEPPENGSLHATARECYLITNAWGGTEIEGEQVAYLSLNSYGPSSKAVSRHVPTGTFMIYAGLQRLTEWDGKGWARPTRPMYIIDGVLAAVVDPRIML